MEVPGIGDIVNKNTKCNLLDKWIYFTHTLIPTLGD